MRTSKLGLDFNKVDEAKKLAENIATDVQSFVENYTTVSVERTLCRLIGIDGVDENDIPLPNVVVDQLHENGAVGQGVLYYLGNAIIESGLSVQEIAEKVTSGEMDLSKMNSHSAEKAQEAIMPLVNASIDRIKANVAKRDNYLNTIGEGEKPYLYVIVATGNIYEDVVQAQAAARQGADIIAVIRTTGQSLLDYVPY